VTLSAGEDFNALGLKFSLVEITTSPSDQKIFLAPYGMRPDRIDTRIVYILSDAPSEKRELVLRYYPAFDRFMPAPSIFRSVVGDTYLSAGATDAVREATASVFANGTETTPTNVSITVKTIPAISLVWLGVAIMVVGSLPFVFAGDREELRHIDRGTRAVGTLSRCVCLYGCGHRKLNCRHFM
jgi:hypothetical protein